MSAKPKEISDLAGDGLRPKCRDGTLKPLETVKRGSRMKVDNPFEELQKSLALFPYMPDDAHVRQPVVEALWPQSTPKLWADIKEGKFPAPVKISKRSVAWRVGDLREFLARERPPANLGVNPVVGKEAMNHDS